MRNSADELVQIPEHLKAAVVAYLTKPIRQRELREALRRAAKTTPRLAITASEEAKKAAAESRRANSRRLLVVEDNLVNQTLMTRLLEGRGHKVLMAGNGLEALYLLERESVDLVLMDVQMPEMDGFQVTAAIREKEQATGDHLPIIAITACALKGDRERCLQAGMDGYLAKPVRPEDLFAAVESTPRVRATVA
jgi:CheY-like chemotaxis protein